MAASLRFPNEHDTQLRLNHTVCRFLGRPVLVDPIGDTRVSLRDLLTSETRSIDANDPELDVSAPPLGYFDELNPRYISRSTLRQQLLGFPIRCATVTYADGLRDTLPRSDQTFALVGRMILGMYPSLDEVMDRGTGGAIARDIALNYVNGVSIVMFRTDGIGFFDPASRTVLLQRMYQSDALIRRLSTFMNVEAPSHHKEHEDAAMD